jgi:ABC-2 type transport system ATP-binding protein
MQTLGHVKDLLQVKDVTHIETRGMSEGQITQLRSHLFGMGVNDTKITHPTTTLEDLFMRIVRENTGNGDGKATAYTGSPEAR